jgi:putative transposase
MPGPTRSKRSRGSPTLLQDTLLELFPSDVLQRLAEQSGFIRRYRKVDPVAFFWAVTLEAGVYLQRSLDQLRHVYNERAAKPLHSYASFYDRFTPELVEFLHLCVAHGLSQLKSAPGNRLSPKLSAFEDVLIQDSTIVRLSAALASHYPPVRRNHPTAGAKIAALVSVRANGPQRLELTAESVNERDTLQPGPWVKGSVLLLDLGFYKHQGFARIEENGGFYLTRLHGLVDPTLVRSHRIHRGATLDLKGKGWREVEPQLKGETLDAEVAIDFGRRKYGGRQRRDTLTARLVAVWNEESRKYHTYLTNIRPEVLSAEEVADLYGCRWEVEMVFKELKSQYALDRVNTTNRSVAEALIWASLLTLVVSRRLHSAVREGIPEKLRARYPPMRWGVAFREQSGKILETLMQRLKRKRVEPEPLLELARTLMARALDPNTGRERFRAEWWG